LVSEATRVFPMEERHVGDTDSLVAAGPGTASRTSPLAQANSVSAVLTIL